KLEKLLQLHKDNWTAIAQGCAALREEASAGRTDAHEGLSREATTFHDFVVDLAFADSVLPSAYAAPFRHLIARIVEHLQATIGIIDFWRKPVEVKQLRAHIGTELQLSNIPELVEQHERIAVEI